MAQRKSVVTKGDLITIAFSQAGLVISSGLIYNSHFELGNLFGWEHDKAEVTDEESHTGDYCAKVKEGGYIKQYLKDGVPSNEIHSLGCFIKAEAGGTPTNYTFYVGYASGTESTPLGTVTCPTGVVAPWCVLQILGSALTAGALVTHIKVESTSGVHYIDDIFIGKKLNVSITEALPEVPTALLAGEKTVATAGTPEALGSGAVVNGILIQAKDTNTGYILVGNSSSQKVRLYAEDSVVVVVDDLSDVYLDTSVNGEGVNYVAG